MTEAKWRARTWLVCAFVLAALRVGAFGFLEYKARIGKETIDSVPLILMLYPEALVLSPRANPILFAAFLVFGSAFLTSVVLIIPTPRD